MDIEEAHKRLLNLSNCNGLPMTISLAIKTILSELENKDKIIKEMVRIDPHIYRVANIRLEEREGK